MSGSDRRSPTDPRTAFRNEISQALALLEAHDIAKPAPAPVATPLPSLLEQCRALLREASAGAPPPIRTVHHFACTGGTLICRCLAAMPGAQVLSEVDPLSPIPYRELPRFAPSDLSGLLRSASRPADPEVLVEAFLAGLDVVYADARRNGLDLVLRDHAHSHFCCGDGSEPRPTLRAMLQRRFPLLSIVTVRHPLDSFLGLSERKWRSFEPFGIDEYCRRYLGFLDAHADLRIERYEDFVREPILTMRRVCAALDLPFDPAFPQLFSAIRLSGDSGRRGDRIAPRPRRAPSRDLARSLAGSEAYAALIDRLGYDP